MVEILNAVPAIGFDGACNSVSCANAANPETTITAQTVIAVLRMSSGGGCDVMVYDHVITVHAIGDIGRNIEREGNRTLRH